MTDFLGAWSDLSSEGLFGSLIDILETAGDWAGAIASLIGLL